MHEICVEGERERECGCVCVQQREYVCGHVRKKKCMCMHMCTQQRRQHIFAIINRCIHIILHLDVCMLFMTAISLYIKLWVYECVHECWFTHLLVYVPAEDMVVEFKYRYANK